MKSFESSRQRRASEGSAGTDNAFTLTELLVTISIMGILAAILIPAISGMKERGLRVACASNIRALVTATLQEAAFQGGEYPDLHHSGLNYPYWFDADNVDSFKLAQGLDEDTFYSPSNEEWNAETFWDYSSGARVGGFLYLANDNNWAASAVIHGDSNDGTLPLFAKRVVDESVYQHLWVDLTRELSSGWGAGVNHQESGEPTGFHAGFRDGHVEWVPWDESEDRSVQVGGVRMWF